MFPAREQIQVLFYPQRINRSVILHEAIQIPFRKQGNIVRQ